MRWYYYHAHYTKEELEAQRDPSDLPKDTQQVDQVGLKLCFKDSERLNSAIP
jgi:hypothetical protein